MHVIIRYLLKQCNVNKNAFQQDAYRSLIDHIWGCLPGGGVSCDLCHHAFVVTCMLFCHQLRLITSAAAYIVFGHVTCGASWHTPLQPVDRMTDMCKNITFANSFVGGNNSVLFGLFPDARWM